MSFAQRFGEWAQRVREPDPRPRFHGDDPDPRYPSPRELRTFFSWILDIALHVGIVLATIDVLRGRGITLLIVAPAALLTYIVASFVNRVLIQRVLHASLGKALLGLIVIRRDNGDQVPLGQLTSLFFLRGAALLLDAAMDEEDHLSTVRRRDVKALRAKRSDKPLIEPALYPPHHPTPWPAAPTPGGAYHQPYPNPAPPQHGWPAANSVPPHQRSSSQR
ncbi:hypothetical protein [Nocardia sp. NPDC048505]|uniref:hypothetical protein n=1 Tax=unclassified Nocardia TaxID=2637762 RepID=UPI0033D02701